MLHSKVTSLILSLVLIGLCPQAYAQGNSKTSSGIGSHESVKRLLPSSYDFKVSRPAYLWRSLDERENISLVELKRPLPKPRSVIDTKIMLYRLFDGRKGILEFYGMRKIVLENATVSDFRTNGTQIDFQFSYTAPSGKRILAQERIYSSPSRVRTISHTVADGDSKSKNAAKIFLSLEPKWGQRKPAADGSNSHASRLEAEVCLDCLETDSPSNLKPLPLPSASPTPHKWLTDPACKDVAKEDLKSDGDEDISWMTSLYNEGTLSSGIGCAQGAIDLGIDVIWAGWEALKGGYKMVTDSEYREETLTAIGTAASETWNDPVGVATSVWNAVTATLIKEWEALPCLNDRAGARVLCNAVAGLIAGGHAIKILKFGLKAAMGTSGEISTVLKAALGKADDLPAETSNQSKVAESPKKNQTPLSDAEVNAEIQSPGKSATGNNITSSGSRSAAAIRNLSTRKLPFRDSLAKNIEEAKRLGNIDEDLFLQRVQDLGKSGIAGEMAYDELRRMDLLLSEVLKSGGESFGEKVDAFLSKAVSSPSVREKLRSCLIKN